MRPSLEIKPFAGLLNASIKPPGSKSITNRALLCAAMAKGDSCLVGALNSDDSLVMIDALNQIGAKIEAQEDGTLMVAGCAGEFISPEGGHEELFVKNSGTTIRFLTAALAISGGNFRLSGIERMHERPIKDLIEALQKTGTEIRSENANGCPPVVIESTRADSATISVRGDISSQYLSGLLMAAPLANGSLTIQVEGTLISKPYVEMTLAVMKSFGVSCITNEAFDSFTISENQQYQSCEYSIEPDASAASYFWGAAAICGGTVKVLGLNQNSLQGDVAFAKALAGMGCVVTFESDGVTVTGPAKTGLELCMADISDTAQTMSAVALFLPNSTAITGIAHNRVKETDRIGNLAIELRKFGAIIEENEDGFVVHPPQELNGARIETYDDHRMAMSLALVGLKQSGVIILDPDCCSKTYPNFFEDLESLRP